MPQGAGIQGTVELRQIKLGAGRIFRGTSAATFDGTVKFDTNSPGATWEDLGATEPDTQINCSSSPFIYKNGVPSARKKGFVIAREATVAVNFSEFKARLLQLALGLVAPINKLSATLMTVAASPAPTNTIFTVDTVSGLAANDEVVLASASGGLAASSARGIVSSIATLAITLRQAISSTFGTVVSTWVAKKVISTKLPFGGSDVDTYPLLFVKDFIGGAQIVWFFPQVASMGNLNPAMGSQSENVKIPITFDAYGIYDADLNDIALAIPYNFET